MPKTNCMPLRAKRENRCTLWCAVRVTLAFAPLWCACACLWF